ncbi:Protein CBG27466 [Caenorhabditis briggsae]|uniref:Protein CBG27466 n=2 Tax=Caenorhabditis briggsae TaxID=6238 RepID=B6IK43_CAEBR|nr:Protein CBG27466 [Caenorhabditis briggsae]UMM39566.1 hypothetical protein L5515_016566 [Caenorhabditis briggsae]CAS00273.1 Protein CBG27466 [Caenorhabditis briggsae]
MSYMFPFTKTKYARHPKTCEESFNMSFCIFATLIISISVIVSCILVLLCIKFATDRDARRSNRVASNVEDAAKAASAGGVVFPGDIEACVKNGELAGLTNVATSDETL